MFFHRLLLCIASLSTAIVIAYPIGDHQVEARAETQSLQTASSENATRLPIVMYTGAGFVADARQANANRKRCKTGEDCKCPKTARSTSCINGTCSCDNPAVNLFANIWMKGIKAVGNAGITKAIGKLMEGLATAKQVAGMIVGAVLGRHAKEALKLALNAFPDVGPSAIDKATKGILTKVL